MIRTTICDLFGIEHPIILGGMGGGAPAPNTDPEIVAAVSNAGGLGVLGCSGRRGSEVTEAVLRIRDLTDRPFGLNLLLFEDDPDRFAAMLAARPAVLSFTWPRSLSGDSLRRPSESAGKGNWDPGASFGMVTRMAQRS
jgi:NAD(P)H-dependent flavin oxidoreductase YrpB (nitropropane dioxygenase family)